ncbi:MAG TPA: hydrogenase/urease maturation nickel metallochaperone HypA [Mycobacteriales bacterium]|nr:hydrogenase/urease maturation nickel metallochaperone HypA [Mycobacteriales bacterium]
MHEYHAVSALVALLQRDPSLAGPEVRVRASPVFCADSLQQAFEMLTADTALAGSRLAVEEMSDRRTCARCGWQSTVSRDDVVGHAVVCPRCGAVSSAEAFAGAGSGIELLAGE